MVPSTIELSVSLNDIETNLKHHFDKIAEHNKELNDCVQIDLSLKIQFIDLYQQKAFQILIEEIVKHQKLTKKRIAKRAIERILQVIIANVRFCKKPFVAYSRSPNSYKNNLYNPLRIGFKNFIQTLTTLETLAYIDEHFIAPQSSAELRRNSRFRISDNFIKIIDSLPIEAKAYSTNLILVKNENKELVELKNRNRKIKKISSVVDQINNVLFTHKYCVEGKNVDPPQLRRIFNKSSLELGGRFYCHGSFLYQFLSEDVRSTITINNEPTIELDFKAMHPSLMYALNGLQLQEDAYAVGLDRSLVKEIFHIAVNSKKRGAVKAVQNKIKIPTTQIKQVLDLLTHKHEPIKNLIFSKNIGLKLQYIDSTISEQILLTYIKETHGLPILPIHDSFIVQKKYKSLLKTIMENCYTQITKFNISISEPT